MYVEHAHARCRNRLALYGTAGYYFGEFYTAETLKRSEIEKKRKNSYIVQYVGLEKM